MRRVFRLAGQATNKNLGIPIKLSGTEYFNRVFGIFTSCCCKVILPFISCESELVGRVAYKNLGMFTIL